MSATKKPRLDAAAAIDVSVSAGDSGEEPVPLFTTQPDSYISAKQAIRLRFGDGVEVEPEFVHQIFDKESIRYCAADGPPLEIKVHYSLATLDLYYSCNVPLEGAAEAALYTLAAALPTPVKDEQALLALEEPSPDVQGDRLARSGTTDDACDTFCATLADAPAARLAFHERLQSVFRWAIETADPIDVADDRWRLYTVWRRHEGRTQLVAACTVFRFQRWVAGEGPRVLFRICQVVVLPPFRGQGHGSRLLHAIYEHAMAEGCLEVTVEDPNPSFRLVRDLTDARTCMRHSVMTPDGVSSTPTDALLAEARKVLPVTDDQLLRCYELQQYVMLQEALGRLRADGGAAASEAAEEAATKPFRLALKRRLNRVHREELDAMLSVQAMSETAKAAPGSADADADADAPSREELVSARKARLEQLYQEHVAAYAECARRLHKRS